MLHPQIHSGAGAGGGGAAMAGTPLLTPVLGFGRVSMPTALGSSAKANSQVGVK